LPGEIAQARDFKKQLAQRLQGRFPQLAQGRNHRLADIRVIVLDGREQALERYIPTQAAEGSGGLATHLGVGVGQRCLEGRGIPGLLQLLDHPRQAGCGGLAQVKLRVRESCRQGVERIHPTQPAEGIQRGAANGQIGVLQSLVKGRNYGRVRQAIDHLAGGLGSDLVEHRIGIIQRGKQGLQYSRVAHPAKGFHRSLAELRVVLAEGLDQAGKIAGLLEPGDIRRAGRQAE
jgi:hypothetical protein